MFAPASANAISIRYEVVPFGGSDYQYIYSLSNDGPIGSPAVELFSVLFDRSQYLESSLEIVTSSPLAGEWDELILASGAFAPAAYDALALSGGVPVGGLVSGFSVEFSWLGAGVPGAQPFEIYDPVTFELLEVGTTTPIPEPSTLTLCMAGLALLATRRG